MTSSTGSWFQKTSPGSTSASKPLSINGLALLVLTGAAIVLLHEAIKYPLRIPGQHGLETMALLAFARLSSGHRWAATITAATAAGTAGLIGAGHGWSTPFLYLVPGILMDVMIMGFAAWRAQIIVLPLIAAFAYAAKPVIRLFLAEGFGMQFGSFRFGALYPICTHLAFGFAGALAAVLAWRLWEKQSQRRT